MIKRTSLVWKRPGLSDADFRQLWLGEHVEQARGLPGLREYVIDFVDDPPPGAPSGIATMRFDSLAALDAAFGLPGLKDELMRTRDEFAASVQVMFVDEQVVVPAAGAKK